VCVSRLVSLRPLFFLFLIVCCFTSYFAAKDCTYTDSSGRPVPAPLASKPDKPTRIGQSRRRPPKDAYLESSVSAPASSTTRVETLASPRAPSDSCDDYAERPKRPRLGSISFPAPESQASVPLPPRSTFAATRFDFTVVRELVNRTYTMIPGPCFDNLLTFSALVFFAHCHPHRLLFHQPTFMADVCLGRIPPYLLHALCSLASPFSKQPAVKTDSPRTAGVAYSKAAGELMFDTLGRLSVDRNLMTVQALCLLESHQSLLSWPWPSPTTHHRECLGYKRSWPSCCNLPLLYGRTGPEHLEGGPSYPG
jgi:Fungal specific transcription factor domain